MKYLIGFLSFLPLVYMAYFMYVFSTFRLGTSVDNFQFLFGTHILIMVLQLGLLIYFIKDIYNNRLIKKDQRAMWILILFIGNVVAIPFYWYKFILKS